MPRPIGSGNIRPTQSELATLRKMTKALAADGDGDALAALATHRLADILENGLALLATDRRPTSGYPVDQTRDVQS